MVKTIRNLEELGMEMHSKEMYFPVDIKVTALVDEVVFENFILSRKCDVVDSSTLKYVTTQGITIYIEVSDFGNNDD